MSATGNPTRSAALRAYGDVFLSTVEAWQLAETNLQNAVATQLQPTHSHRRSHVGRVRVDVLLISAMAGTTHGPPTVVFQSECQWTGSIIVIFMDSPQWDPTLK